MEPGSSSISAERAQYHQKIEPFLPRKGHDPFELRSWAKRTGFVSTSFSMEHNKRNENAELITEKGGPRSEIEPALNKNGNGNDRAKRTGVVSTSFSMEHNKRNENAQLDMEKGLVMEPTTERRSEIEPVLNKNGNENDCDEVGSLASEETGEEKRDDDGREWGGSTSKLKIGLTEFPGYVPLIYYGLQHYFSLAGSLIFIPLIIVPAMGGTDKDTAYVISTMLLVSGITTILHSYFGTRLPLVQGSSFVYLAPALVIINSEEFRNLTEHKFRHVMRELQGAIVVGSIFQSILGFSGLMSLLVRFINPVVVAPTVAAVGLAFFSYGFPQAGNCVETSVPLILLIFILTLHLRGVSIAGNHVFRIYAVPMSVIIIWAYAFFLTAGGAYNYKGCRPDIPSSNILNEACIKHAYTMKHCRTDVSNACRTAAWVRIPYPLQWGIPVFRLKTSLMMIFVSLVASVDSVGTYHSTSIRINLKTPTTGIVSRGIGLEGFCSILAGLWGTGTGSTTLTENVHTINTTKVASRRAVEIGAVILILFSFIGKVGAILASIPQALAAAVLCFVWALIVALGFSTLRYCQTGSFRNMAIVGFSLFLGFSIPAYVQQYEPETVLILPSYLIPYAAASTGPAHIGSEQLDFAINGLLSLNMVVTFLVALVLDNTVPGSKQERGVYVWSRVEDLMMESSSLSPYSLPKRVSHLFGWAKCLR